MQPQEAVETEVEVGKEDKLKEVKTAHNVPQDESKMKFQKTSRPLGDCSNTEWVNPIGISMI